MGFIIRGVIWDIPILVFAYVLFWCPIGVFGFQEVGPTTCKASPTAEAGFTIGAYKGYYKGSFKGVYKGYIRDTIRVL